MVLNYNKMKTSEQQKMEENGVFVSNPNIITRDEIAQVPPSCCICLDVRTGAVIIGLFNLVVHAAGLVMSTSVAVRQYADPPVNQYLESDKKDEVYYVHRRGVDQLVGIAIACLSFLITGLLVYGAALRKPTFILPFFCMQVFDLSLYVLASAAAVSYAPQIKRTLEMNPRLQGRLENMTPTQFMFILVSFCLLVLLIKTYLMSVVWACFKHCKAVESARRLDRHVRQQLAAGGAMLLLPGSLEPMALLPSYEETVKSCPPPVYSNP